MAKPGPRTTRRYSDEFKAGAVRLSELPGVEVQDVATSLCIHPFMLSRWRKQAREGQIVTKGIETEKDIESELQELREIKKAYERLKVEHDLLKNRLPGLPRPMQSETRGATLWCVRTEAVSFLEASTPSKNLVQGKLRTRCWWRDSRPRLGM